tara:strand:- start:594 stop:770 length:177 start_codon:yes stop_codon:yes gene_type:complete
MPIHSSLILLFTVFFLFTPSLEQWLLNGSIAWYRPHLIWLGVVIFIYFNQQDASRDEL